MEGRGGPKWVMPFEIRIQNVYEYTEILTQILIFTQILTPVKNN